MCREGYTDGLSGLAGKITILVLISLLVNAFVEGILHLAPSVLVGETEMLPLMWATAMQTSILFC